MAPRTSPNQDPPPTRNRPRDTSWPRRSPCGNFGQVETRDSMDETSAPTAARAPAARPHGPPCRSRRDPQSALPASRLRDQHPADLAGPVPPASRSAASSGSTAGHCSSSASIVCPSGPGAPLFDATFNSAAVKRLDNPLHRHRRDDLHVDDRLRHHRPPIRPGPVPDARERPLSGFLLSRSADKAAPSFARPGPPSLARRDSIRPAQRALPRLPVVRDPPTSAGPSSRRSFVLRPTGRTGRNPADLPG